MNTRNSLVFAFVLFAAVSNAQDKQIHQKTSSNPVNENVIYTAMKPADASPYVFSSEKELASSVPSKKEKILAMIRENEHDAEKVKQYREELWRLENAKVTEPK